jgi:transcriptional regulator with XRE-family HTH domain
MSTGMPYCVADNLSGMPRTKPISAATSQSAAKGTPLTPQSASQVVKPDIKSIAGRLQACRQAKGITKAELARRLKVSAATVGDWENGDTKAPTGENLLNMRDAVGYDIDYIVRGKGMPMLPNFEEMARESMLISIFRDLGPGPKQNLLDIAQSLRRAHGGGPSPDDPFLWDAPRSPRSDE